MHWEGFTWGWEALFICPLLFSWLAFPFQISLVYFPFLYLPLKGLLQKLPNSQKSLICKQRMLLNHQLPIYWCPYSFISQSLCSSMIASPVTYPASPSTCIFPGTSNLTCPLWTHNLAFRNLLLPSPSLAQFMVSPSSWLPSLESLAPPLLLPSPLTPHCATQSFIKSCGFWVFFFFLDSGFERALSPSLEYTMLILSPDPGPH